MILFVLIRNPLLKAVSHGIVAEHFRQKKKTLHKANRLFHKTYCMSVKQK